MDDLLSERFSMYGGFFGFVAVTKELVVSGVVTSRPAWLFLSQHGGVLRGESVM